MPTVWTSFAALTCAVPVCAAAQVDGGVRTMPFDDDRGGWPDHADEFS